MTAVCCWLPKQPEAKKFLSFARNTGEGLPMLNCLNKTCLMRIQIKTTLQLCITVNLNI